MFIYEPKSVKKLDDINENIKNEFGIFPIHWEFLASVSPKRFEMFIDEIRYLLNHPNINPDFFSMIRLYVANREDFSYCKSLNTKLLLAKGYDKSDIKYLKEDISKLPLDNRHISLAKKVIKALYHPKEFLKSDIDELKDISWSDNDIYDAIDHGAFLFKFSKILKAYTL
jgi:hypothetical protein